MSGFDDFYSAIAGQESGGNYNAVNNRTGALGKFQIMPANIVPWSKQYLGRAITPGQFLSSPALQEQLARAVLMNYYNSYGARGAASAWYSGSPTKQNSYVKFNSNEPSIGEYVDQVMARMGGGQFGYTPAAKVVDNRVKDTPLATAPPDTTKLDALSGVDRNGLGLKQVDAMGLQAPIDGPGLAAPTVDAPVGTGAAAPKAAVGPEFQKRWDAASAPVADGLRGSVVDLAKQFIGTPYVWGGTQPGGFDCSGLIQYAMKQAGFDMPRVSFQQLAMGQRADVGSLQPGDLVGFGDGSHVALYLGGGQILEAPRTGLNVRVRSLGKNENAWGVSLANLYRK